jgi:membrane protease YdiL (CAAX protease family)
MSTATENQRSAGSSSSLGRLVARQPVVAFLVMAYAFGWPALLAGHYLGLSFLLASSLSVIFGLALPAFLVTAATGGKNGVRDLLRRCFRWRVGLRWYLLALLGLPVGTLLAASAFPGLAPLQALVEKWPLVFTVFVPSVLIPLMLIQLWEETGWTGFMQDTLQERHGPLLASVMAAPAFVLFHLPLVLLEASQIALALFQVAVQAIVVVFLRVMIMWLYNGAGRSVLIVALFHSAFNSVTGSGYATRFIRELIAGPAALLISLAVLVVAAVLVTVFTRGRLAYERAARPIVPHAGTRQEGGAT